MFTKYPHAGFAKTRLIPRLGADGAAQVSRALSERCVLAVRSYVGDQVAHCEVNRKVWIYYAGRTTKEEMKGWLGEGVYVPQCEGDLGARMMNALKRSFDDGAQRVVIVGTDIPELDSGVLCESFDALKRNDVDVVCGPAVDGGYYLIGMKQIHEKLFRHVEWSTDKVFETTRMRVNEIGMKMKVLKMLRDVDWPEDVEYLKKFINVPVNEQVE